MKSSLQIYISMKAAIPIVCAHKMHKLRVPHHASKCHDVYRLGDTYLKAS